MRTARWLVFGGLLSVVLLLPREATAIGCWVCDFALDSCYHNTFVEFEACVHGCDVNPYPGCVVECSDRDVANLQRCQEEFDYCTTDCDEGPDKSNCPIVIALDQAPWRFTSAAEGVLFDIDDDGQRDPISWTEPGAEIAFLVWDRNTNGTIDSGRELFGDSAPQPPSDQPNGFLALALLDRPEHGGDGDGAVTSGDGLWSALRLWVDRNHNGRSDDGELLSLESQAIVGIDLAYRESRRRDRFGNELRYRSRVHLEARPYTDALDVFFERLQE